MREVVADVLVIGGGPAGLSAALVLARANQRVLLCDAGERRNASAEHMHGFVSRDGVPPSEFRRIAREQLRAYAVTFSGERVTRIERDGAGFAITFADDTLAAVRRVLLATGIVDELPPVSGLRELWGHGAFACPYCHGYELRDRTWGILLTSDALLDHAYLLTGWTRDVVAFANGATLAGSTREALACAGIALEPRRIARFLAGPDRALRGVDLDDGTFVALAAMIVRPPQKQVELVEELGLELDARGFVRTSADGETSIAGIYAAGDLADPVQAAILAAAAGTRAAYAMNRALQRGLAPTRAGRPTRPRFDARKRRATGADRGS